MPKLRLVGAAVREEPRSVSVSLADVTIVGEQAEAIAQATPGTPQRKTDQLEDAGFDVQWLRVGDAWMVRVFDRDGKWIAGSVQDDMETAILAVADSLLPKSD